MFVWEAVTSLVEMHVEAVRGIRAADIPTDAACSRFRGTPRVGKGNEKDVSMNMPS